MDSAPRSLNRLYVWSGSCQLLIERPGRALSVLNCWVCFTGEPIGMCERHDRQRTSKGWGSLGRSSPFQLPTIYSVNDLGFAAMKAGFAIERLHPLRALSGQPAGRFGCCINLAAGIRPKRQTSAMGHSLPGPAASKPGHVRPMPPESGSKLAAVICLAGWWLRT